MKVTRWVLPGSGIEVETLDAPGLQVICFSDLGIVAWPQETLLKSLAQADFARLSQALPAETTDAGAGNLMLNFNIFLLRVNGLTVMVDAGIGSSKSRPSRPAWHEKTAALPQVLAAFGMGFDDIDLLVLTHFHADHLGWTTIRAGEAWVRALPRARYLAPAAELAALAEDRAAFQGPSEGFLHGAWEDGVRPIDESGGWEAVEFGVEIAPGLSLEAVPGHTAAQAALRLKGADGQPDILFCSDAIHHHIQLADPDLVSNFCTDPAQAVSTRRTMLERALAEGTVLAPCHFTHPAFGRVERAGAGYAFIPLSAAARA